MLIWLLIDFSCIFKVVRLNQKPKQRQLDKGIYKTEMKFWAVLGSRGCREKKIPTAISMKLSGVVSYVFMVKKLF